MPSRLRVIFLNQDHWLVGSGALKAIAKEWPKCPWVKPLDAKKLVDWYNSMRATNVGFYKKGYSLTIWRERRKSRGSRKVYWRLVGLRKRKAPLKKKRATGVAAWRFRNDARLFPDPVFPGARIAIEPRLQGLRPQEGLAERARNLQAGVRWEAIVAGGANNRWIDEIFPNPQERQPNE